jgi:shikimate kinase
MPPTGTTPRRKLICLTGFMGSGKTTIGRHLARQLAWSFVDLDTRIEEHAGLRISEIFERLDEPAFREIEHELLIQALAQAAEQVKPMVLALGGGTFAQPRNVERLRANGGVVIWLDCPVEKLLLRCATIANRPLFRDEASFRKLYEERRPFYQLADFRVESSVEPQGVIEQILALGIFERVAGIPNVSPRRANA